MGRTAYTESQYLYKRALYLLFYLKTQYWHLYVLAGLISVWPWDLAHRFSRATPYRDVIPGPLTATDMYIVYNVTHFEYSRNVNHHMRYVITCVGADCGRSRGTKIKTYKWFGTFIIKDGRYMFTFSQVSENNNLYFPIEHYIIRLPNRSSLCSLWSGGWRFTHSCNLNEW
jgi:hypothetical protein